MRSVLIAVLWLCSLHLGESTVFSDWLGNVIAGHQANTALVGGSLKNLDGLFQRCTIKYKRGANVATIDVIKITDAAYQFIIPQNHKKILMEIDKPYGLLTAKGTARNAGDNERLALITSKRSALREIHRKPGHAEFYFYPAKNEGKIIWVGGASHYISITGCGESNGVLIVNIMFDLFKLWSEKNGGGQPTAMIKLEDASTKFCNGHWWDRAGEYDFKTLRAFEGHTVAKPVSYYGKMPWGFILDTTYHTYDGEIDDKNAAVAAIRALTKANVKQYMNEEDDSPWDQFAGLVGWNTNDANGGEKLGLKMVTLNRANCQNYIEAMNILVDIEGGNIDSKLEMFEEDEWHYRMKLDIPGQQIQNIYVADRYHWKYKHHDDDWNTLIFGLGILELIILIGLIAAICCLGGLVFVYVIYQTKNPLKNCML